MCIFRNASNETSISTKKFYGKAGTIFQYFLFPSTRLSRDCLRNETDAAGWLRTLKVQVSAGVRRSVTLRIRENQRTLSKVEEKDGRNAEDGFLRY